MWNYLLILLILFLNLSFPHRDFTDEFNTENTENTDKTEKKLKNYIRVAIFAKLLALMTPESVFGACCSHGFLIFFSVTTFPLFAEERRSPVTQRSHISFSLCLNSLFLSFSLCLNSLFFSFPHCLNSLFISFPLCESLSFSLFLFVKLIFFSVSSVISVLKISLFRVRSCVVSC